MSVTEKFLITGFSGFVSQHFLNYLESNCISAQIIGIDINTPDFNFKQFQYIKCDFQKVDLLDKSQVELIINTFKPNYVLHCYFATRCLTKTKYGIL